MAFKAETKKLLDIVAKSIYTDKEVFLRELLSNSSDALEKQRFKQISGQATISNDPGLFIEIITNPKERILQIFDSGIGMTREEIVENLGTIAKSGSQAFLEANKDKDPQVAESIIGQFGVGFYSSFIVADSVEVFSKSQGHPGVRWISDGSGEFEVSDVDNIGFERGTKIVLKLKPESRHFSTDSEIEKIIKKFSQFISYSIKLNGQVLNNLQAIWSRDKREVTLDEYERFYENLANTKIAYKYMIHYQTDVPLTIKSLLYIPSHHNEKLGLVQEQSAISLYSRKILIKQNCPELLPHYLRFVKGVVDCEDLPLNISRESYQDSSLMQKLRNVITRRVLKLLEDESKKDVQKYDKWFLDFQMFLKEGLTVDTENQEQLFKIMRYNASFSQQSFISLDDYIAKMKQGQDKIYFIVAPTVEGAMSSPFMEPFKEKNEVPVLILNNNIDEVCFQQHQQYKQKKFVNIEASYEEIQKDIGGKSDNQSQQEESHIPEADVTAYCLWLKNELTSNIGKVTLSKRLKDTPAIIVGQVSSSMRMILQMMEQSGQQNLGQDAASLNQNQTLEINGNHPLIVNLNQLRKTDPTLASLVAKTMLDSVMMQNNIPFDTAQAHKRNFKLIEKMLDANLNTVDDTPQRKTVNDSSKVKNEQVSDVKIEYKDDGESILNKAHKDIKSSSHFTDRKVVHEHVVSEKDFQQNKK